MDKCKFCGKLIGDGEEICKACELEAQNIIDTDENIMILNLEYAIFGLGRLVCCIATVLFSVALLIFMQTNFGIVKNIIALLTIIFCASLLFFCICRMIFHKKIITATENEMHKRHQQ